MQLSSSVPTKQTALHGVRTQKPGSWTPATKSSKIT